MPQAARITKAAANDVFVYKLCRILTNVGGTLQRNAKHYKKDYSSDDNVVSHVEKGVVGGAS